MESDGLIIPSSFEGFCFKSYKEVTESVIVEHFKFDYGNFCITCGVVWSKDAGKFFDIRSPLVQCWVVRVVPEKGSPMSESIIFQP